MKQNQRARSARITAAATGGSVFVQALPSRNELASVTSATLSEAKSKYQCTSCTTTVVASSHAEPHCVACGSDTKVVQANVKASPGPLIALECSHCNSVSLLEAKVVQAANFSVHCSACGESSSFKSQAARVEAALGSDPQETEDASDEVTASELEEEMSEGVAASGGDSWPFEDKVSASGNDPWPFDDLDDSEPTKAGAEIEDMHMESVDIASAASEAEGEEDLEIELEDLDEPVSSSADETPRPEEIPAEMDTQPATDAETPVESPDPMGMVDSGEGEPLVDALDLDDTEEDLSFVSVTSRLVAMKGHVAIASLRPEDAGTNADLIENSSFHSTIAHVASKQGLRKALASVGFRPIRIQSLTAATVAKKVQAAQQSAVNSAATNAATFTESLALAAAGLARNFWKNHDLPLQAALVEELRAVGARNPERIAAKVIAASLVPTAKTLADVSCHLNSLPETARREMATVLEMTKPLLPEPTEEDEPSDLSSRLTATAAVLPVTDPTLSRPSFSRRESSRQAAQIDATARALKILDGSEPLNFG